MWCGWVCVCWGCRVNRFFCFGDWLWSGLLFEICVWIFVCSCCCIRCGVVFWLWYCIRYMILGVFLGFLCCVLRCWFSLMGLVLLYMVVWFEFECDVFYEYCDWVVLWFGWVGGCGVLWLFVGWWFGWLCFLCFVLWGVCLWCDVGDFVWWWEYFMSLWLCCIGVWLFWYFWVEIGWSWFEGML